MKDPAETFLKQITAGITILILLLLWRGATWLAETLHHFGR
jgi:hypothetical protein